MERDKRPNDGLFCRAGTKPFQAEFFRGIVPRHHRNVFNVAWLISAFLKCIADGLVVWCVVPIIALCNQRILGKRRLKRFGNTGLVGNRNGVLLRAVSHKETIPGLCQHENMFH